MHILPLPQISLLIIIPQLLLVTFALRLLPAVVRAVAQIIVRAGNAVAFPSPAGSVHVGFASLLLLLLLLGRVVAGARGAEIGPFACAVGLLLAGAGVGALFLRLRLLLLLLMPLLLLFLAFGVGGGGFFVRLYLE